MIEGWEQFESGPDFYHGGELPNHYRFSQIKEELHLFLNDLPDFTKSFSSYLTYRNSYLKIHAPLL